MGGRGGSVSAAELGRGAPAVGEDARRSSLLRLSAPGARPPPYAWGVHLPARAPPAASLPLPNPRGAPRLCGLFAVCPRANAAHRACRPCRPGTDQPQRLLGLQGCPPAVPGSSHSLGPARLKPGGFRQGRTAAGWALHAERVSPDTRPARRGAPRCYSGKSFPFQVCSPGPVLAHTPPAPPRLRKLPGTCKGRRAWGWRARTL